MFFFSPLGSRSGGVLICFSIWFGVLCILDAGCVCVDGPSVCGSGSMSLVLCFFSSVGQFVSSLLGYVFLFSLGMLEPGVFISPLPSMVNRLTEWRRRAITSYAASTGGVRFEHKGRWEILGHGYLRCLFVWMDAASYFSIWLDG